MEIYATNLIYFIYSGWMNQLGREQASSKQQAASSSSSVLRSQQINFRVAI
jgi:hypothetical protein